MYNNYTYIPYLNFSLILFLVLVLNYSKPMKRYINKQTVGWTDRYNVDR